jgi:steroid delta-isomerase-like uncharacterized protein
MEDQQIVAFNHMMDAVNGGDAKRYAQLYAPDAVVTIYGVGELIGRGAVERYEAELLREFPGTRLAFYSVWQKGGQTVVHYAVNSPAHGGRETGHEGLLFYRFAPSGLIEQERRYLDSLTPMAQVGLLGQTPARDLPTLATGIKVYAAQNSPDEDENVALVRANFTALDSKKESIFLAKVADDAVLDELINPQPFIGKRNIKAWFETWARTVPDATSEITTILGVGEFVLVETIVRGTLKGKLAGLEASDKQFEVHRGAIIQVKHGKFTRIAYFMNGKELAAAVGQWPPPIVR